MKKNILFLLTGSVALGLSIRLLTCLDKTIHWPLFPNILDCLSLGVFGFLTILVAVKELDEFFRKIKRRETEKEKEKR